MKKITEELSIDTWKYIAYAVQRLNITGNSETEYLENLKKLKKLLSDIDIDLSAGNPESKVGISTLLQSIYKMDVHSRYKKARFYEKIYQLSDLGVETIQFQPIDFVDSIFCLYKTVDRQGCHIIKKAYTDGKFSLCQKQGTSGKYFNIHNIEDANYLLCFSVANNEYIKKQSSESNIVESTAILKNFNGSYPSIEEVKSMSFPKLIVPEQTQEWGNASLELEENFNKFDETKASYQKRLTRTEHNQFYYKEYKK